MTYQSFLTRMMSTPDSKLAKADIVKLAEKYSVPLDWAKMSVRCWLRRT